MIKLKDLYPNQPSFIGVEEPVKEEFIGEAKIIPTKKIDSKIWRQMKWDMRDQIDELNKIGQDYGVFQNAQYVSKTLKKIKKLWDTL
jgi:hypothetical protein